MVALARRTGSSASDVSEAPGARIGPNAVIRLGEALRDRLGQPTAETVFRQAGLKQMLTEPPAAMVDQQAVVALYESLFAHLPLDVAAPIAAEAGRRTADYLLAHRIPRFVQFVLRALPPALAAPPLLGAIKRNAWTFAGSGRVETRAGAPIVIEIADNPLAMPGCVWHAAVFERLFGALVAPQVRVSHPRCCHDGDSVCRFEIRTARRYA